MENTVTCRSCGADNLIARKFCGECGAALGSPARPRQVRKTVTVLFADIAGSTAMGEVVDAETVRALTSRYFLEIRRIIERHGGIVEKFIGDAAMAVFGIPRLHEDDPLRAVRAAVAIAEAVDRIGAGGTDGAPAFRFRMGIATGEVVAGEPASGDTLVTGDTVNTAARLEQSAAPGEILISAATQRLVREAVIAEEVTPVRAKGKSAPVIAFRVGGLTGKETRVRRRGALLVGRDTEFEHLVALHQDTAKQRVPHTVTIVGVAGAGKSRLVGEFLTAIGGTTRIYEGRCLPYGDGITYWPLREIVNAAARITDHDSVANARAKLDVTVAGEPDADAITGALAGAAGLGGPAPQDDIFWATRRFVETLAGPGPVVLRIEDIHWAEPTFLDLLEYLGNVTTDVPLLIVCTARPDLADVRPAWMTGNRKATSLFLEVLSDDAVEALIEQLPGGVAIPRSLRDAIARSAEGNPLFVEEMLAMLVDEGSLTEESGEWVATGKLEEIVVPPTVAVLLAARVDGLPAEERSVAQRASVIGRVFEAAALRELLGTGASVEVARSLLSLVRKELLRPDRAELTSGDAFKFRHILIREAAYEALPKVDRAELHERFADWLARVAGERITAYEEIVGYHLEQAHDYRVELGIVDEHTVRLGRRAGKRLAAAGSAAAKRLDSRAGLSLLRRALPLLDESAPEYWPAVLALGRALADTTELVRAKEILDRIVAIAPDDLVVAEARIVRLWTEYELGSVAMADVRAEVARVLRASAAQSDSRIASMAWRVLASAHRNAGQVRRARHALLRSVKCAERSSDGEVQVMAVMALAENSLRDTTPLPEVIAQFERLWKQPSLSRGQRARARHSEAYALALIGRFRDARQSIAEALDEARAMGHAPDPAHLTGGLVELFAGDAVAAERHYRAAYDSAMGSGATGDLSFLNGRLAQALRLQERDEEALRLADEAIAADPADLFTTTVAMGTRSRILARRGRITEADDISARALRDAENAGFRDLPMIFAGCLEDRADVLVAAGRTPEAVAVLEEALALYKAKGSTVHTRYTSEQIRSLVASGSAE